MTEPVFSSLEECFSEMPDPRVQGRGDHKLIDLIIITICAVICGADSWTGVETFARAKEAWLKRYGELPNGIPSHDTLGRVLARLNAEAFQAGVSRWVESVFRVTTGQVVAIDGKTVRRSHDQTIGQEAIQLVSAWASQNGIALGQRKVDDKSNEITAIPELLCVLDVSGCIVTIDAMGCQKEIAQAIRHAKADYVVRVKDNQSNLRQDLEDWFVYGDEQAFQDLTVDDHHTINKSNGRIEIRRCWAIADPVAFAYIRHYEAWTDLQTIVRVQREVRAQGKTTVETAYYISSLPHDAERLLEATRHHWAIENSFHGVLAVTVREDDSRIRSGDSPQKMAVFRHLALNILKQDPSRMSLKQKRFRAGLDDTFLLELLPRI